MPIKILNADDHPILRKGVTDLIKETDEMESVGSAADGREALEKIRAIKPDIALLDIEMPHLTGLEVAQTLLKEGTETDFILLTLFKDETFFYNAMEIGIMGYLLKDSSEEEILDCIRSVYRGRPYVNPSLTHLLMQQKRVKDSLFKNLTEHEINILKLIARQKTTAEIADMLFISPKTVANHRNNISKKLGLSGQQNGLLKWAIENRDVLG
jgi:DNA-binding NarL/FixJ family response regulator